MELHFGSNGASLCPGLVFKLKTVLKIRALVAVPFLLNCINHRVANQEVRTDRSLVPATNKSCSGLDSKRCLGSQRAAFGSYPPKKSRFPTCTISPSNTGPVALRSIGPVTGELSLDSGAQEVSKPKRLFFTALLTSSAS